jgi:hypothetical protein
MNWFEKIFGFSETGRDSVHQNIVIEGNKLHSVINNKSYQYGSLECPTLLELRARTTEHLRRGERSQLSEVVADVQTLHCDLEYSEALFQVASQCNLLEMVGPNVTPEEGITGYYWDRTQGPACAIAAGAGTLFRNYFVDTNGQKGQTSERQIDSLERLGRLWNNQDNRLWSMRNGYALATENGLMEIHSRLKTASKEERDNWLGELEIGIQWSTEVTLSPEKQIVSQAYCSAMPVAYSQYSSDEWEEFARFVLDGAYEATVLAAVQNRVENGSNILCLTLLGGGAFGNHSQWIYDSILRAIMLVKDAGLDIRIISYGNSQSVVRELIEEYELNSN